PAASSIGQRALATLLGALEKKAPQRPIERLVVLPRWLSVTHRGCHGNGLAVRRSALRMTATPIAVMVLCIFDPSQAIPSTNIGRSRRRFWPRKRQRTLLRGFRHGGKFFPLSLRLLRRHLYQRGHPVRGLKIKRILNLRCWHCGGARAWPPTNPHPLD